MPKPARFGCMTAICCQGRALFPSGAPSGIHEAKKLPRIAARERIAAKYCRGKASENASEQFLAKDGHPGTHRARILPRTAAQERTTAKYCRRRTLGAQLARRVHALGFAVAARKARSLAGIRKAARCAQRVREAAQRAKPTGHKKAPLRRTAPSPQNYGRKPDPP